MAASSYSIYYYGNGNTSGTAPEDLNKYTYADDLTLPLNTGNLEKTGYYFAGWCKNTDRSSEVYLPGEVIHIDSNTSMYAVWIANNEYAILYKSGNSDGGTVPIDSTSYTSGGSVTILDEGNLVSPANMHFIGWCDESGVYTHIDHSSGSTINITATKFLYAVFGSYYTVTYNANGADSGDAPEDTNQYDLSNHTIKLVSSTNLLKSNHYLYGWSEYQNPTESDTIYQLGSSYTVVSNVTLYAVWKSSNLTVTYHSTDKLTGTPPVDSNMYNWGDSVTVLGTDSLTRVEGSSYGYFTSWKYLYNNDYYISYAPNAIFPITASIDMYPDGWKSRIIYMSTGATSGSVPEDTTYYDNGNTTVVLGSGTLQRNGYTLVSWNTKDDGTGDTYSFGASITIANDPILLYPMWVGQYTITYDANGADSGSVPTDNNVYGGDSSITILGNTGSLEKAGYVFPYWNTASDGSGTKYSFNDIVTITSSIVLYAMWKEPIHIRYICDTSDSGVVPVDTNTYTSGDSALILNNIGNLVRFGYKLVGWSVNGSSSSIYPAGSSIILNESVTITEGYVNLYAWWEVSYTVTYNANGADSGSAPIDNNVYISGDSAIVLGNTGNLFKTNSTFMGWSTTANGSLEYISNDQITITASVVLYAVYSSYTLEYLNDNSTGGSIPAPKSNYAIGSTVTVLNNINKLTRSKYLLSGWLNSEDSIVYKAGESFIINSDVTLTPVWVASSTYKVCLHPSSSLDVCKIGSDLIKVSNNSSRSKINAYLYNASIDTSDSTYKQVNVSSSSGDMFGEMTSTGIAVFGSNVELSISGHLDISSTSMNAVTFIITDGTNTHFLMNETCSETNSTAIINIPQYTFKVKRSTNLLFKILVQGSGVAIASSSCLYIERG